MAEKQVIGFLAGSAPADGWGRFRENLIGLTDVTRSHFDKLVLVRARRILGFSRFTGKTNKPNNYTFITVVTHVA